VLSPLAWAGVVAIAALAFALTGVAIYDERERAIADGAAEAAQLALVLEEQMLRTIQAVDLTLQRIVETVGLDQRPAHDAAFEDRLRTTRDQLPFVRALFVIGADGFIAQDTDHPNTPPVTLADRPYFRLHRDDPAVGLHIGPPLVSRSVNRWFVSMSRRVDDRAGRFAGIAVAAVEPRYFDTFYTKLNIGPVDSLALFHRDGTLYWRTPYAEHTIGTSFSDLPLFQHELPRRSSNVYRSLGIVDDAPKTVGYRTVEGFPFIVTAVLDERAMLATWRRTALGAVTATSLLVALVILVFVLLSRHARHNALAHDRMVQAQKLEALGRMTGGLAHDFGNVLNVVALNLALLRKHAEHVPAEVEKAILAVRQGTTLASQLLAFAREQRLTIEPCDANALVTALLPLLRQAAGRSIDVTATLAEDLWPCLTDRAQLNSAVLNLVLNARDAMRDGTGTVRISTQNRPQGKVPRAPRLTNGDYVQLTVSDNGRGMSADVLRRAAEPFFTTKAEGSEASGTGLGLSQIYGFTHQVGGALHLESVEGEGTSAHLFFRRAAARA
jgi:signal transduction histidine kinase